MSILIKGAKTPKTCEECQSTLGLFANECPLFAEFPKKFDYDPEIGNNRRYDGCPLVEISPHGRLIDADALKTKLNNIHDFLLGDCEFSELATSDKARIDELTNCIAEVVNAPTVIESEEEE